MLAGARRWPVVDVEFVGTVGGTFSELATVDVDLFCEKKANECFCGRPIVAFLTDPCVSDTLSRGSLFASNDVAGIVTRGMHRCSGDLLCSLLATPTSPM